MFIELIYGFLGAGKTTFIRHLLEHQGTGERWVILVNEFGEVGIDGRILTHAGSQAAAVVELPSGCICCTLAPDFRRQLIEVSATYAPDRILVEPTGLATIGQIMAILAHADIQRLYAGLRLIHLVDAAEFLAFIKANRHFVENQIQAGQIVLLNKADLLSPSRVNLLAASIREINPAAQVYSTSFARLDPDVRKAIFDVRRIGPERLPEPDTETVAELASEPHDHTNGYQSFGRRYRSEVFHADRLHAFFEQLQAHRYGEIVRAKGLFRTDRAWLLLEFASGTVQSAPGPDGIESAVSIIGKRFNVVDLEAQLQGCMTPA